MKKTFLLLFSLILVVSLSACGAKTTRGPKANYVYSFEEEPSLEKGGTVKGVSEGLEDLIIKVPALTDSSFYTLKSSTSSCTEDGTQTYTCVYGDITISVKAKGHVYGDLIPAKAATCMERGNVSYYKRSVCNKYFNESKAEINESEVFTQKLDHHMEYHEYKAATKQEEGNIEYYYCDLCNKNYSDAQGKNEIKTSVVIDKLASTPTMYPLNYPDYPQTGNDKNSWEYMTGEDYTLNWYVDVSSWVQPTGMDEVSKRIKAVTGISVKFETPVSDDGTKLATMIAGGVLPDVISIPTSQSLQIYQLSSQGYVYDINTLAEKWAPSLYKNLPQDVLNWWAFGDGYTYGIPNHYYSYNDVHEAQLQPNGGMMVREDLFNAWQQYCFAALASEDGLVHYTSIKGTEKTVPWQGYITTPEGFKAAAKWALDNYKGTKKGDITTGLQLSQFKSDGCTSLTWLSQFFAIPFEDTDGNYIYQFTEDSYKDMLLYLNDLYNEGIISKSNFTQNYDGVGGTVASAQAFATLVTPQDYQIHFVTAKDSGYPYISMYITNENDDAPVLADIRGYGYLMNMITTNCKRPDLVIKLFDYLTSEEGQLLITLGIEGVTWNWTDETKTEIAFTDQYLEEKAAGTATKYGLMQFDVLINYQLYDNLQPQTNNGKTEQELFRANLKRPLTIYSYDYNAVHFIVDTSNPKYPQYAQALSKIRTLIGKQLPKIIQAANRDAATTIYNKTVQTLNSYGLDVVMELENAAYHRAKEKLGITIAWPPYMEGYDVTPDRLHPNGDTSYYRSY